jgi:hypothetical protein
MKETPSELVRLRQRKLTEETKKLQNEQTRVNGEQTDLATLQQADKDIESVVKAYEKAYPGFKRRWEILNESPLPEKVKKKHHGAVDYQKKIYKIFEEVDEEKDHLNAEVGVKKQPEVKSTGKTGKAEEATRTSNEEQAELANIQNEFKTLKDTQTTVDNNLKALETILTTIGNELDNEPSAKTDKDKVANIKKIVFWTMELDRQLKAAKNKPTEPKELKIQLDDTFANWNAKISKPREALQRANDLQAELQSETDKLDDYKNETWRQQYILKLLHADDAPPPAASGS